MYTASDNLLNKVLIRLKNAQQKPCARQHCEQPQAAKLSSEERENFLISSSAALVCRLVLSAIFIAFPSRN